MNTAGRRSRIPVAFGCDTGQNVTVTGAMTEMRAAQGTWSQVPVDCRVRLVRRLRHLIVSNAGWLAEASAAARGRPAAESFAAEVVPLVEACRFLEFEAPKLLATRRIGRGGIRFWRPRMFREIHREPMGVVLIIAPGNYPLFLPGVQMIQALVAGNAVLLKPGTGGSASAERLCELLVRAGFERQLIKVLPESADAAGEAIAAGPDKVLFTGSAAVGQKILASLAPRLIPATLELSGSDAVIVRGDADLDLAAKALKFGLELNGGETCISPKRVFVERSAAIELEARLAQLFSLPAGKSCPAPNGRTVWPPSQERLKTLIQEALAHGAHFVAGGFQENGSLVLPVILAGVLPFERLLHEDIFAPVLSLVTVADECEAVFLANHCPFALGASVFSRDETAARATARKINAGVVTINDLIVPTADPHLPFGGRKRSGFGVTRGAEGLLELTAPKVVTVTRGRFRPAFEPLAPADFRLLRAFLTWMHGAHLKARTAALLSSASMIYRRTKTRRRTI